LPFLCHQRAWKVFLGVLESKFLPFLPFPIPYAFQIRLTQYSCGVWGQHFVLVASNAKPLHYNPSITCQSEKLVMVQLSLENFVEKVFLQHLPHFKSLFDFNVLAIQFVLCQMHLTFSLN
jgi:hypothetical protein